jgi:hypothetical protein
VRGQPVITSAGNRKLDKKRASRRIDGMTALAMALGVDADHRHSGFDRLAYVI